MKPSNQSPRSRTWLAGILLLVAGVLLLVAGFFFLIFAPADAAFWMVGISIPMNIAGITLITHKRRSDPEE